ncbi:MAG: hypothetical protein H0W06_11990 [Chloroflexia bacterium]|nr:hypothetical protein [Chloroflexia bacterium]
MPVLIDEALVTAFLTIPLREGWIAADQVSARPRLAAVDVGPSDAALLPAGDVTELATTHAIVPEVALVCDGVGAVAMRTPVRPDGIEATPVRLYDVSRTAELLMRATLRPFFGITAAGFVDHDAAEGAAEAQVVVVEGAEALRQPEAGFQDDLCRAWFILTGLRLVSHVLVVPLEADDDDVAVVIRQLRGVIEVGVERRREVRVALAADSELDRDRLVDLTSRLRFTLEQADRESLHMLIARGSWGTRYPRSMPTFREPDST